MKNIPRYDVVFWAHGHNETERFLPIMSGLMSKGVRPLLFFQNYGDRKGFSPIQEKIISKYGMETADYSFFVRNDPLLMLTFLAVRAMGWFRKSSFLYNKFNGLRSRLLQMHMTEALAEKMLAVLKPKVSFFDTIDIAEYTDYPHGSYYIKKVSDKNNIKCLCISHGGTTYVPRPKGEKQMYLDFYKIYQPNNFEKEWCESHFVRNSAKVVCFGDPRFDNKWKDVINSLFAEKVKEKIERMDLGVNKKILYITPNLAHITDKDIKYRNLEDVARVCRELGATSLLIKPHPRNRDEREIGKLMKRHGVNSFFILDDDPIVCYMDHVDFIVSLGTSALYDALPAASEKIVIYADVPEQAGFKNIFRDCARYFGSFDEIRHFFMSGDAFDRKKKTSYCDIKDFCNRWFGAGMGLDGIIDRLSDDIIEEIRTA